MWLSRSSDAAGQQTLSVAVDLSADEEAAASNRNSGAAAEAEVVPSAQQAAASAGGNRERASTPCRRSRLLRARAANKSSRQTGSTLSLPRSSCSAAGTRASANATELVAARRAAPAEERLDVYTCQNRVEKCPKQRSREDFQSHSCHERIRCRRRPHPTASAATSRTATCPFRPRRTPILRRRLAPPSSTLPTTRKACLWRRQVLQLREWANERNQLQESLAAAEQEAEQLRQRLAEVEGTKKAAEQPAAKPRLPLNTIPQYNSRHTAKEVEAIATQRQVEQLTKKSIENAKLREEWRAARETMARVTGPSFAAGR